MLPKPHKGETCPTTALQTPQHNNINNCLCDFCSETPALLHCPADEARLCLACDRLVHASNSLFSKHPRAPLCDACHSSPATALLPSQQMLLCQNCDFQAGGRVRRPIEPFSGCPGAVELMGLLGVGEDEKRLRSGWEGEVLVCGVEESVWEGKEVFNFDDLIGTMDVGHGLRASGVPPLPKDRNLFCGKHKEEILKQLQAMFKSETDASSQLWNQEHDVGFQPLMFQQSLQLENKDSIFKCDQEYPDFMDNEEKFLSWQGDYDQFMGRITEETQFIHLLADGSNGSNTNQDCVGEMENDQSISMDMPLVSPRAAFELSAAERDSAITRYREKRKIRRYEKRVIYESRKARAESRIRIRGRFAKTS